VAGLRSVDGVEVAALCDSQPDTLAEQADRHAIPGRFAAFEEMLESVDAVVVATPMQLHAAHAIQALDAGRHVLSEVTACVSMDEAWRLLDAVRRSGRTYMMAENYCYSRDTMLVGELARRGMFGELYYGEGEYLHEVRDLHHNADGSPTWRYHWQVGVNGCTYGTHSLGPVMMWFTALDPEERIESVVCVGTGRHTDPEHPHDDTSNMLCRLRSGKQIRVRLDMMSNRPRQSAYHSLQGTTGVFEASRFEGEPSRVWFGENRHDDKREWQLLSDYAELLPEAYQEVADQAARSGHGGGDFMVAREFALSVVTDTPPPVDIYSALEWTAAGLCSQVSIDNGGVPIRVPNFRDPTARPLALSTREE
jgi:predicted dehydrogenase